MNKIYLSKILPKIIGEEAREFIKNSPAGKEAVISVEYDGIEFVKYSFKPKPYLQKDLGDINRPVKYRSRGTKFNFSYIPRTDESGNLVAHYGGAKSHIVPKQTRAHTVSKVKRLFVVTAGDYLRFEPYTKDHDWGIRNCPGRVRVF